MKDIIIAICIIIFTLVALIIGPYIWYQNYKECRTMGFSFMYCSTRK